MYHSHGLGTPECGGRSKRNMPLSLVKFLALTCLLCLALLQMSKPSDGAKILLLPVLSGSHILTFKQLGEALAERGHELHTVANEDCKGLKKLTKIGVINHGFKLDKGCIEEDEELKKVQMSMVMSGFSLRNVASLMWNLSSTLRNLITAMLSDAVVTELRKENFDIAIVDAIVFSRGLYIIPYRLGIPTISVAAVSPLLSAGVPALPSFTPFIRMGAFTDKMTFTERLQNTMLTMFMDEMSAYSLGQYGMVAQYAPEMPYKSLSELQAQSAFWLIMNEITIDYPQVSLPHVVNIGGINTGPAAALKGEMKTIADGAQDGLIIVSFGSTVSDFPPEMTKRLYDDLKHVKGTVIWRYTGKIPADRPPNMHLSQWLPQNDLLAHPNTKVFVTHCGCNGQFEALYSGVPMVGLPIFGDQRYNCVRMVAKGMGVQLDLGTFKPGELISAIKEVMHNQSYTKAIKKASAIFRSQPQSPINRAMYWIEHVLEHGHEHLRSPAVDMPWYQYWCFDVLLFMVFVTILITAVFLGTVCFIFRKCRARFASKKSNTTSSKAKKKRQ